MRTPSEAIELFGVTLVGATPDNARKLLVTVGIICFALAFAWLSRKALASVGRGTKPSPLRFWGRQVTGIAAAIMLVVGVVSVWFDDPTRLTTALGLVTAGIAFALQRVITAIAGYFVILRGKTFNVGDRIVMGGVRGDVIALTFMQTKIMEMGQPPPVASAEPATWVYSRQFTGRIVTVSNDKIFDEPIYNYTYHFPYVWEEMRLPVRYGDDRATVERILLTAAARHAVKERDLAEDEREELERRYRIPVGDIEPNVYWRITDNWLELTVRFLTPDHGTRRVKDAMSREIMAQLDAAGIGIASATYEITAVSPLELVSD